MSLFEGRAKGIDFLEGLETVEDAVLSILLLFIGLQQSLMPQFLLLLLLLLLLLVLLQSGIRPPFRR